MSSLPVRLSAERRADAFHPPALNADRGLLIVQRDDPDHQNIEVAHYSGLILVHGHRRDCRAAFTASS